jgi:hypothetical protein
VVSCPRRDSHGIEPPDQQNGADSILQQKISPHRYNKTNKISLHRTKNELAFNGKNKIQTIRAFIGLTKHILYKPSSAQTKQKPSSVQTKLQIHRPNKQSLYFCFCFISFSIRLATIRINILPAAAVVASDGELGSLQIPTIHNHLMPLIKCLEYYRLMLQCNKNKSIAMPTYPQITELQFQG